jgi:chitinase
MLGYNGPRLTCITVCLVAAACGGNPAPQGGAGGPLGPSRGGGSNSGTVGGSGTTGGSETTGGGTTGGGLPGANTPSPADGKSVAVYWGQNGGGGEPSLAQVCAMPQYKVVLLSFMTSFGTGRTRNPDGYPELNFAFHCETPYDARNPFLLKCDDIAAAIPVCQQNGKKVLISMGGAVGGYGLSSDADAQAVAETIWNMFLGGTGQVRPFGQAVLDGVDLDIEGGAATGYAAFAKAMRQKMGADPRKKYYISAAPQCPFPDAYLGPAPGTALAEAATAFDFLFVQFYNNFCGASTGASFTSSFQQWAGLSANGGPKIFVGLPAAPGAGSGFVAPDALPALIGSVKGNPAFAGAMLWDVSFDQKAGGGAYSAALSRALGGP